MGQAVLTLWAPSTPVRQHQAARVPASGDDRRSGSVIANSAAPARHGRPAAGFWPRPPLLAALSDGRPAELDTFDPKPQAPAEIRGELRPIATRVPGIRVSELCPRLAAQADRVCLVRAR